MYAVSSRPSTRASRYPRSGRKRKTISPRGSVASGRAVHQRGPQQERVACAQAVQRRDLPPRAPCALQRPLVRGRKQRVERGLCIGRGVEERLDRSRRKSARVPEDQHQRVVEDDEAVVGVAQVDRGECRAVRRQRRRRRQAGPGESVVHQGEPRKRRVVRLEVHQFVPQVAAEQERVVAAAHRVAIRQPCDTAVQPAAVQHHVVGLGKLSGQLFRLLRAVRVVQGQLADVVSAQVGNAVVPVLPEHHRVRRQLLGLHPRRRLDCRVRAAVHARVRERVQRRRAHDYDDSGARPGRQRASARTRPVHRRRQHLRAEQQQEGRRRQHVPEELRPRKSRR